MATVDVLSKGTKFPEVLVTEFIDRVRGHSTLARLSDQKPLAFRGNELMVFNLPNQIDVVAENGPKSHGGGTVESKTIQPIKFEYGMRVSDEFMFATEEERMDILGVFADGAAKKVATGFDIAGLHGLNPRTGEESQVIGDNCFDKQVETTVSYVAANADENLQEAVNTVQAADSNVTGAAMSPVFASALANIKENGVTQYPEFRFGQHPDSFYGLEIDVNSTIASGDVDQAIVGDFREAFRWGIAKDIKVEVIPYGDPDNSGFDLKGSNQVYLRAEIYLGWAVLVPEAFARVTSSEASE